MSANAKSCHNSISESSAPKFHGNMNASGITVSFYDIHGRNIELQLIFARVVILAIFNIFIIIIKCVFIPQILVHLAFTQKYQSQDSN
jgi:hypothetical protein